MPHAPHGIMPGNGSVLDPVLKKYMDEQRRLRIFEMISAAGRGLMAANRRGQSPIQGLSAGLAQGRPAGTDPIEMLRMQETIDQIRARQDERLQARGQHASQEALTAGNRYDPRNQILWNTPPAPGRVPPSMTPLQRRSLAAQAYPKAYGKAMVEREFPKPATYGAPTAVLGPNGLPMLIRVPQGRGAPIPLGGGYTPMPKTGGITLSQQSSNAEIDQARATLDRKGLDKAEIYRRTQKATNTGRTNTEYDEGLDRIVRMATQRKTGADPEYRNYYETYLGGFEFSEPAGHRELPPAPEPASLLQQTRDFLFGAGNAAGQPPPGGNGPTLPPAPQQQRGRYRRRGRRGPPGQAPRTAIPQMSLTEIDDLIKTRGDSLSPAELTAIQARLAALNAR